MSDTILVTGASGHLGGGIIRHLLDDEGVAPGRIIAVTRDVGKLTDFSDRGVSVRAGDFRDGDGLARAFAGADKVLVISGADIGQRLAQHEAAIKAAVAAGAKRIAYTSMPNPEPGNAVVFAPEHFGTEQAIKATGLPYTIFRNGWYQENLLMSLPQALSSGKWYSAADQGRVAHAARDDMAAAIAAALASNEGESATYTLTGPEALTTDEIAARAASTLGKSIEVIHVSDEQLAHGMKAAGVPAEYVPMLVSFDTNTRNGGIDIVTGDLETLSGRKPRPLEDFLTANRAALLG